MKNAIIIMTKVPKPGLVKTRLQPFLSPDQSAGLAAALLLDAETKARSVTNNTIIAFSPIELRDRLISVLQHEHELLEQTGRDLGERMYNAFEQSFDLDFDNIVMIGTDSPGCPAQYLGTAFEDLSSGLDSVVGEAKDGGFYLIGLKKPERRVFRDVKWSSPAAFDQTVGNIDALGLSISLLPICSDIDREEDLRELALELSDNPELAPTTANWLADNLPQ